VKTEGEATGANWTRSQPSGRGSIRRKPDEAASRAKGRHRCESEVGCRPSQGRNRSAQAGWIKTIGRKPGGNGIARRKPEGSPKVEWMCGTADASRRFAASRAEGYETDPSRRVGHRSSRSASHRRKSEVLCRRSQRIQRQRKLESGHWGSWRTQHRLYCE
jgi:hypothetical protein